MNLILVLVSNFKIGLFGSDVAFTCWVKLRFLMGFSRNWLIGCWVCFKHNVLEKQSSWVEFKKCCYVPEIEFHFMYWLFLCWDALYRQVLIFLFFSVLTHVFICYSLTCVSFLVQYYFVKLGFLGCLYSVASYVFQKWTTESKISDVFIYVYPSSMLRMLTFVFLVKRKCLYIQRWCKFWWIDCKVCLVSCICCVLRWIEIE